MMDATMPAIWIFDLNDVEHYWYRLTVPYYPDMEDSVSYMTDLKSLKSIDELGSATHTG